MKKKSLGIIAIVALSLVLIALIFGVVLLKKEVDNREQELAQNSATPTTTQHTHSYAESITTEATCATDGVKTFTCECGDSYTEAIKAIGHSYEAVVTAPSCTKKGYTTYTCNICKDTYTDNEINATGHSYNEGVITAEATCETDGVKTFTCECGYMHVEMIKSTGHSYENYVYNKDASYKADGTETATCICGKTDTRTASGTKLVYTYTSFEKTMYAKSSVNVRDLPSTDGNKLGALSANQAVVVTGQCNETNWYRIKYNDLIGYVSGNYLETEITDKKENVGKKPTNDYTEYAPAGEVFTDTTSITIDGQPVIATGTTKIYNTIIADNLSGVNIKIQAGQSNLTMSQAAKIQRAYSNIYGADNIGLELDGAGNCTIVINPTGGKDATGDGIQINK